MFSYPYPHPAVTADICVFTLRAGKLCVLLIRRGPDPFKGDWALPGGFIQPEETVEQGAARELAEETGVTGAQLVQFGIYSGAKRDPRGWTISIAYLACVRIDEVGIAAGTDAAEAEWFEIMDDHLKAPLALAFDHKDILSKAIETLRDKSTDPHLKLVPRMMPPLFKHADLVHAMSTVMDSPVDRANFYRQLKKLDWLEPVDAKDQGRHRPAQLFKIKM